MAEDQPPAPGKKVHPALLAGPAVAIVAAIAAVFIATSNQEAVKEPAAPSTSSTPGTDDPIAQPSQAGDDTPVPPGLDTPSGATASVISPDGSSISFSDAAISFSAALPPGPASDPNLASLRKDAQAYLASKKAEAHGALDEFKKSGAGSPAYPWEVMISWEYTARAGDIVSLFGSSYEFTGGAHGMTRFDTFIARSNGERIAIESMLEGGLSPAIVIALCEALKKEKQARTDSATIYDEPIVCAGPNANVKVDRAKIVLAPSNQPGKFGGLYVYWEPYEVGSYAEGSYAVTIQQEIFAQDLKAEFKPLFSGEAPPLKD